MELTEQEQQLIDVIRENANDDGFDLLFGRQKRRMGGNAQGLPQKEETR